MSETPSVSAEAPEKPKQDASVPKEAPFGVNEMRMTLKQWLATAGIVLVSAALLPRMWKHVEKFDTPIDYRIPYAISSDYWLYQWRADQIPQSSIPIIGDSVVWGEYVQRDGTLSHFLSQSAGQPSKFVNCGVNGVFPLALEGLVANYGQAFSGRKVIVQCNLLWQSSPKADLSDTSEQTFNHTMLVPQGFGQIPCYKADAATRMGAWAETHIGLWGWVNHVNAVYYKNLSMPRWALEEDGSDPPTRPNAWRNPLSPINLRVPAEPAVDTQRGPASKRHKAWNAGGAQPSHFEWVDPAHSLQWQGFQRLITLLKSRGADVFVILGPFNEHMVAEDQRSQYTGIRDNAAKWFEANGITHIVPEPLPTELYADASHPLTDGYALLAKQVYASPTFTSWLNGAPR